MTQWLDQQFRVNPTDLDEQGQIRPGVYLDWLSQTAQSHLAVNGLDRGRLQELGHLLQLSQYHAQYRLMPVQGDQLVLRTWLGELSPYESTRYCVIYRPHDGAIIMQATSRWRCIELATGRSKRLSPTFLQACTPLDEHLDPLDFSTL